MKKYYTQEKINLLKEKKALVESISFLKELVEKVYLELKQSFLLTEGSKVVLAVSGGVDSVTLLDVFYLLRERMQMELFVAHYNHGLRGKESELDAKFVKSLAEKYGLPFHSTKGKVREYAKSHSLSLESAGRVLRYDFLRQVASSLKAGFLATAHNLDDSIETFFINLFRGTGVTGLCGIPAQRNLGKDLVLIRPLLKIPRSDILEYAKLSNLDWREDSSNRLLHFTRNKIRNNLLPYLKEEFGAGVVDTIYKTIQHLRGVDGFIMEHVQKALPNLVAERNRNYVAIKIPLLETYSDFFKGELLQAVVEKYFKVYSLSLSAVDRIVKLAKSLTGSVYDINEKLFVLKDRDYLVFSERLAKANFKYVISKDGEYHFEDFRIVLREVSKKEVVYDNNPAVEFFDYDKLPEILFLRPINEGDVFMPLGMKEEVKLSDFLINLKISKIEKQNVVLMASKQEIIWVCGYRISEKYKVTKRTKRFIKAEFYTK